MADALAGILESPTAERLATGFGFTEGPLWHPDGFYYFVDIRRSELHRLTPGQPPELVRAETGEGNGTTFDLQGRLVICEGGNRRVTRWAADGRSEVLVDRYEGKRLNRPNDVVCRSDGSLWFTDPGLRVPLPQREVPYAGVYRIAPDGTTALMADCEYPNGLAFSPDERTLYVANTRWTQYIHAFELDAAGQRAAPPDLRRHVLGRDRRRARRHEGRRRGARLLHGPRRHLGVRARRRAARHHPHAGGPGQRRLRRPRPPHAVLHRPHVGLHAARQGARPAASVAPGAGLTGQGFASRRRAVLARVVVGVVMSAVGGAAAQPGPPAGQPGASETAPLRQTVPSAAAASPVARTILDAVRPSVIQIKGFFGTNTAEAFHGSGFAVAPSGVFVTNWHVVSDAVLYPEKYRLEYRTPAGATGRITVRAIDIRHDLALVEAENSPPPRWRCARPRPSRGSARSRWASRSTSV